MSTYSIDWIAQGMYGDGPGNAQTLNAPTATEFYAVAIPFIVFPGRKVSFAKGLGQAAFRGADQAWKFVSKRPLRSYMYAGGTAGGIVATTPAGIIAKDVAMLTAYQIATRQDRWYDSIFRDRSPPGQGVVLPASPETVHPLAGLSRLKSMSLGGHQLVQPTLGGGTPTRQRRRRKPARRMRAKKWCWKHRRYDRCK